MDTIVAVDTSEIIDSNSNETYRLRTDSLTKTTFDEDTIVRSPDVIEPIMKKSHSTTNGFNVGLVYESFTTALKQSDNPKSPIGTQEYINGYRELLKFFDQLGYVFKFVKDDVVQKLTILQHFVDNDDIETPHFDIIQKGIDYETEKNLIKTNPENFARTLLRLHRALIFIEEFLRGLSDRPASDSTVAIATTAYDSTLYNHHGFLIRTTVKVGFRALPSRKQLDEILFHGEKSEMMNQYKIFIKTIREIYDIIQNYYAEKNYLQLP